MGIWLCEEPPDAEWFLDNPDIVANSNVTAEDFLQFLPFLDYKGAHDENEDNGCDKAPGDKTRAAVPNHSIPDRQKELNTDEPNTVPSPFDNLLNDAEQGKAYAQYKLGVMYQYGQGVRQNYAEAVKWYWKAAEQEYDEAQFSLGSMYETGLGVFQSYTEAARWYQKAAEHGNPKAQSKLGYMYYNGEGVKKDYQEAYKWFA